MWFCLSRNRLECVTNTRKEVVMLVMMDSLIVLERRYVPLRTAITEVVISIHQAVEYVMIARGERSITVRGGSAG